MSVSSLFLSLEGLGKGMQKPEKKILRFSPKLNPPDIA